MVKPESHILEHMMFKGTNKLGPGEFSSIVKKMGGTDNALRAKISLVITKKFTMKI